MPQITAERIGPRIGASIRAWRKKNGLTISRLAERADIDPGFLAYIETGKKLPSVHTSHKLAEALGITLSELFHGVPAGASRGLRAELSRAAQSLCLKCSRNQHEDLIAVFRHLDDPRKVRAILTLVGG
ncbi:MAG: helix-turn-helix domain-containing protein [Elusimicrobiota bacterium]|nr:MAG: helix-turn-helix domain-containing protein [Elusimicrobiota bacterium]